MPESAASAAYSYLSGRYEPRTLTCLGGKETSVISSGYRSEFRTESSSQRSEPVRPDSELELRSSSFSWSESAELWSDGRDTVFSLPSAVDSETRGWKYEDARGRSCIMAGMQW